MSGSLTYRILGIHLTLTKEGVYILSINDPKYQQEGR